jgi:hypothetical protein
MINLTSALAALVKQSKTSKTVCSMLEVQGKLLAEELESISWI